MQDFLNRRDVYSHRYLPHDVKKEKQALEEKNTVVIPNKKSPFTKKIKKMFRGFNKTE